MTTPSSPSSSSDQDPLQQVVHYHERTKHHPGAYARSLGYLDWATQPDPFRRFDDAPFLPLAYPPRADEPVFDALFTPDRVQPQPLNQETISRLFQDSLALSAWKQAAGTSRWSLRINPSSGDLHPTEGYLIAGPLPGLSDEAGVYHYSPFEHALERRWSLAAREWQALAGQLPAGAVLVGLASIHWRESWKYGERAFRYCHHDVGHAIGTVSLAAAALGWRTRLVETVTDADLAVLLGVHRQRGPEAEHPDCLLAMYPASPSPSVTTTAVTVPAMLRERLQAGVPTGTENLLSRHHHPWPIIDEVAQATRYDRVAPINDAITVEESSPDLSGLLPERPPPARQIIFQRRSAVAMDGKTSLEREVFYHLLARVSPRISPLPFRVFPWRPQVALGLFVHRVRDLDPGLYVLARDPAHEASLRAATHADWLWRKPPACPAALALYLLQPGDARDTAQLISCHQEIAADGAFALGMLARFQTSLDQWGPWFYPRLFWETGLIGQLLYLEAEAAGVRATGIGCFFDDLMHQVLGIADRSWQSLYHFTVGGAVEDARLQTLEPYFHLPSRRLPGNPR